MNCAVLSDGRSGVADELILDSLQPGFLLLADDVLEDVIHRVKGPSASFRHKIGRPNEGQ